MAEGLLRTRLARARIDAQVSSAGLVPGGMPATPTAVEVLADRGINISGHESRLLGAELVRRADLVLGMARSHVREAVVHAPEAFPRIFTLKELVHRCGLAGARASGQPIGEWLAKLHAGRRLEDLLGSDPLDDIADPIGRPRRVYEATASELDHFLAKLVDAAWPAERAVSA